MKIPADIVKRAISVNAECFGKKDQYSNAAIYNDGLKILESRHKSVTVAYLVYRELPDYLSIDRLGSLKEHRKKGHGKKLLQLLKMISKKVKKPIRTYVRYDNLPSYLLHIKSGFYPTHVAWNTWVWIEYKPKIVEV